MCRSIKILRSTEVRATPEEISAAALQFVRKVSGYQKPSRANTLVFNRAIAEISGSVERLLTELEPSGRNVPRQPAAEAATPLSES
jgi:hypothetical protein